MFSNKKELYELIRAAARRAWWTRDAWEDVAHEAWIIAYTRGYFDWRMLREAARNLGIWQEGESLEALVEAGREFRDDAKDEADPLRRRLGEVLVFLAPKFREAAQAVLDGCNFSEAARKIKIDEVTLSAALGGLGEKISGKRRDVSHRRNRQANVMPLFRDRK